jgi:beta-lactamase regulating signal transducer with metallopeptidase domain
MLSFLLSYLLKLSITLCVLYAFYRVVLRQLTFYQWNRFYLLVYSLIAFIIPLIDVSSWVSRQAMQQHQLITLVPVLNDFTQSQLISTGTKPVGAGLSTSGMAAEALMLLFLTGFFIMVIRLVLQYASLRRIRRKAVLLTNEADINIFQTTEAGNPFSFGRCIYISRSAHTGEELQRMVQHEMVHVKQKHTVDVLIGEFLCVVNWFNPFAWLIRQAIRQNLEFIADNKVITRPGVDKKQYQYLLLKVAASPAYRIAHHFNFSHLKKRIAMMNKIKTAKAHVIKFLFVLPFLALVLVAFRKNLGSPESSKNLPMVNYAAIVLDADSKLPVAGVVVKNDIGKMLGITNENGYILLQLSPEKSMQLGLLFTREGYNFTSSNFSLARYTTNNSISLVELVSVKKGFADQACKKCFTSLSMKYENQSEVGYREAKQYYDEYLAGKGNWIEVPAAPKHASPLEIPLRSAKPLPDDVKDISVRRHIDIEKKINIQVATVTLANGKIEKYDLTKADQKAAFEDKYGEYQPIPPPPPPAPNPAPLASAMEVTSPAVAPEPPTPVLNEIEINAPMNPSPPVKAEWPAHVKKILVKDEKIEIILKNGTKENYDLTKPGEKKAFEKKYGAIAPPAPGAPRAPEKWEEVPFNSKGYKLSVADNNGECVIIVKNSSEQIIKAILLTEWNGREKYYTDFYGEIPPATRAPLRPTPVHPVF